MNATAFGAYLDERRSSLTSYGQYVIEAVTASLRGDLTEVKFKSLLKVPPTFRVKDSASAIQKITLKGYKDPMAELTDVVGVRFVVLLESDIGLVEKAIINCNGDWTPRKDRFPLFEIKESPEAFQYQSTHFVIRLNQDITIDGNLLHADTPCEVQIRTLVQHAYAEFVHDRVYKPGKYVPSSVRRLVARAMAMLESTDLIFSEAANELACVNLSVDQWMIESESVYSALCGSFSTKVTEDEARLFFETFQDLIPSVNSREVEENFRKYAPSITLHRNEENVFGHHFVVVMLWLVSQHDQVVAARWPMEKFRADLTRLAAMLGIAL